MHEAGLAAAIVAAIHDHGLEGRRIRVLVAGGHDQPDAFDESLRFHMTIADPDLDPGLVAIVHLPTERWCPSCGHRFAAVGDADCPACGRATMAERTEERIELEVVEDADGADEAGRPADGVRRAAGPGSSGPADGDARPSAPPGRMAQA